MARVVVVGAGAAGLAAAWSASRNGAQVTMIDGGVSATQLSGGALDDVPWEELERAERASGTRLHASALSADAAKFIDVLSLWRLVDAGMPFARLVTLAGRTRIARGHDHGLLDLGTLPDSATILLPRISRAEWDADSLARCLNADPYAHGRGLRFVVTDASWLRHVGEDRIPAAAFAAIQDENHEWLLKQMRTFLQNGPKCDALLCGPWLGGSRALSRTFSDALGIPVGEVLAGLSSPTALRYAAARKRLLSGADIVVKRGRVSELERQGGRILVHVSGADEPLRAHAAVLAVGGLASGGITYKPLYAYPGASFPQAEKPAFQLSLKTPGSLCANGQELGVSSSIHGPDIDANAWPKDADAGLLEAVGLRCSGVKVESHIYAAGDVVADRQRTLLAAIEGGVRAGKKAATEKAAG